ncbi:MAG: hypothetical protein AAGD25_25110 [Cyanobacteria bacterium P01_F01_bin.150]
MNHPEPATKSRTAPDTTPIGLMAPSTIQAQNQNLLRLQIAATQLLKDPLRVWQLTERVYQLIQQDLQYQRERLGQYGSRR